METDGPARHIATLAWNMMVGLSQDEDADPDEEAEGGKDEEDADK